MAERFIAVDSVGNKPGDLSGVDQLYDHGKSSGVPNLNHGTLTGGAFFDRSTLPGQLQGGTGADEIVAAKFDGINDHVLLGDGPAAFVVAGNYSLSAWIRVTSVAATSVIIGKWEPVGDQRSYTWNVNTSSQLSLVISTDGTASGNIGVNSTGTLTLDQWHYVAVTISGTTATFYIDGVASGGGTTGAPVDSTANLMVGDNDEGAPFVGWIAQPRKYDRALSAAEALAEFNHTGAEPTDAVYDGRGSKNIIEDAESGAPGGTTSMMFDGSDDVVETNNAPFTAAPFSISGKILTTATSGTIAFVGDKDAANEWWRIGVNGSGKLIYELNDSGVATTLTSTTTVNDGAWHSFTATSAAANDHSLFVDTGAAEDTDSTSSSPANADRVSIGRIGDSTPTDYFAGISRDIQIHNDEFTQTDHENYHNRVAVADGLTNNWLLDDIRNKALYRIGTYADTAQDSIGSNHGTLTGFGVDPNPAWTLSTPQQLSAAQDWSLDFDGIDDYVDMGDNNDITAPFTLLGWVKLGTLPSTDEQYSILSKYNTTGNQRSYLFGVRDTNDKLTLALSSDGTSLTVVQADANTALVVGQWYCAAVSVDASGNATFYLDGTADGTASFTPTVFNSTAKTTIGAAESIATAPDLLIEGLLADVRIYSAALSADDIATLSGGGTISTAAAAQWKIDDAREYSDPVAWEADLDDATLYVDGDWAIAEHHADAAVEQNLTINGGDNIGGVADALSLITYGPASGDEHNGSEGSGVVFLASADDAISAVISTTIPVHFSGIEFDGASNGRNGSVVTLSNAAHVFYGNIVHDFTEPGIENADGITVSDATAVAHNNLVYNMNSDTGEARGIVTSVAATIYSNTVYNCTATTDTDGVGIETTAVSTTVATNNIVIDCDADYAGSFAAASDYNLSSDTTAPGTNAVKSVTAANTFRNVVLNNFSLRDTSPAGDAGTDLHNTGFAGISVDITNTRRKGTWSIGAFEFVLSNTEQLQMVYSLLEDELME